MIDMVGFYIIFDIMRIMLSIGSLLGIGIFVGLRSDSVEKLFDVVEDWEEG